MRELEDAKAVAGRGERRSHPARAGGPVPRRAGLPRPHAGADAGRPRQPRHPAVQRARPLAARRCGGYRRHIAADPEPFFHDEALAVMGVNTARPGKWKRRKAVRAADRAHPRALRPHPGARLQGGGHPPSLHARPRRTRARAGGARVPGPGRRRSAAGWTCCSPGHLHMSFSGDVRPHYLSIRRSMLVAQAGTSTSRAPSRRDQHLQLDRRGPAGSCASSSGAGTAPRFEPRAVTRYVKRDDEWVEGLAEARLLAAAQRAVQVRGRADQRRGG